MTIASNPGVDARPASTPDKGWGGRGLVLAVVCFAQFMLVLDATVSNVMTPVIRKDIHTSLVTLQWVMTSYVLVFGGFMLLGGRLADLFGRRRMFVVALTLFTVASLLAGLSSDISTLIAARALQGLGAAFLSPAALSILVASFPDRGMRAKALGMWGTVIGLGASFGTLLGGAVVEGGGWRLAFLINVPVGVVLLVGARVIPARSEERQRRTKIGLIGAALATSGLALVILGFTRTGQVGWISTETVVTLGAAVALLVAFVQVERGSAAPVVPRSVLRSRAARSGSISMFVAAGVMFPFFFLMPQYLQDVLGYTPFETGLAYLPTSLSMVIVSGVVPMLLAKFGTRMPYVAGALIVIAGVGLMSQARAGAGYWATVFPIMLLMGVGLVVCMMVAPVVATSDASEDDAGAASAVLNSSSEIGGAIGLAVAITAVTHTAGAGLTGPGMVDALQAGALVLVGWAVLNLLVGAAMMNASRGAAAST